MVCLIKVSWAAFFRMVKFEGEEFISEGLSWVDRTEVGGWDKVSCLGSEKTRN